eukprot:g9678.t1
MWIPKHDPVLEAEFEQMLQRVQFDLNRAAIFEPLDAETRKYAKALLEAEEKLQDKASTANAFDVFKNRMRIWQRMAKGRDAEIKAAMSPKVLKHSRKFNLGLMEFLFERFLAEDTDGYCF